MCCRKIQINLQSYRLVVLAGWAFWKRRAAAAACAASNSQPSIPQAASTSTTTYSHLQNIHLSLQTSSWELGTKPHLTVQRSVWQMRGQAGLQCMYRRWARADRSQRTFKHWKALLMKIPGREGAVLLFPLLERLLPPISMSSNH